MDFPLWPKRNIACHCQFGGGLRFMRLFNMESVGFFLLLFFLFLSGRQQRYQASIPWSQRLRYNDLMNKATKKTNKSFSRERLSGYSEMESLLSRMLAKYRTTKNFAHFRESNPMQIHSITAFHCIKCDYRIISHRNKMAHRDRKRGKNYFRRSWHKL